MATTQIVSTAMAAELLQSVGVELTIFAVSIVFALTFRGSAFGKQIGGCQASMNAARPNPSRADNGRSGSPGGGKKSAAAITPANPVRQSHQEVNELAQKVDCMINCASKRQSAEALAMYKEMKANGEYKAIKDLARLSRKRPTDVFTMLVQCAGSVGRPELVEVLLDDMTAAQIERPLAFYESTMKMLASKKCYKEAMAVCSRLEADGLEPSPVTLSCLISFAVEIGEADRAIGFFERLAACSMPSIRAYMTIFRVHSRRQDWTKSLALIRDMQNRQAPIDSLVLNIALSTAVAAASSTHSTAVAACQLDAAKALLTDFATIGLADVVSYNTVLKGLAQQKAAEQALSLLEEMCKTGVKPNSITFNTTIDAAVRSEQISDAWLVLTKMLDAGDC
jgi:pentatricopeptide repeat protein